MNSTLSRFVWVYFTFGQSTSPALLRSERYDGTVHAQCRGRNARHSSGYTPGSLCHFVPLCVLCVFVASLFAAPYRQDYQRTECSSMNAISAADNGCSTARQLSSTCATVRQPAMGSTGKGWPSR